MKILVTGAKGFVGRNLVESLKNIRDGKDQTHPIPGLTDPSQLEIVSYDRESTQEELDAACAECDFVFNLAGVNRPKDNAEFMKGNVGFATRLLDTLKKHHNTCPVMLSSSIQATLIGRYGESDYGKSKLAGEKLFFCYGEETGARVLVYRFPNLFGKWCRPNYNSVVATFCYNMAREMPVPSELQLGGGDVLLQYGAGDAGDGQRPVDGADAALYRRPRRGDAAGPVRPRAPLPFRWTGSRRG